MHRLPTRTTTSDETEGFSTNPDQLFAHFAPLVKRLIRQYGQNQEMREDLVGETYYRFCALYEAFDPTRGIPFRAYMVRQLSLSIHSYARRQWVIQRRNQTGQTQENLDAKESHFDPTSDWLAALSQQQIGSLLPAALEKLPARQRRVVIWRYYEERTFEEIANMLGVQPVTVRSLLRHGITKLRQMLSPSA